mmetsp:Transcript_54919/g.128414  ORF Transcript_54919/g.128414 Transcript_54919/m.128414 type:complete len:670 (+) Transcript_54919:363-2372(+)
MASFIKDHDFVNEFLFAAPTPATYNERSYPGDLFWLDDGENQKFPNLFLCKEGACCCIMYLHGNAEDLGLSHDLLKAFRDFLNVHVLGVEYPGYGPVPGNPCEGGVNRHTRAAFNFLTQKLRIPPQRIIVFGRSIGTGPATNLVSILSKSRKAAAALVLQSPYRSIKTLAKELVGAIANVIMDRFDNEADIVNCHSPTLIIHGRQDELIPVRHASVLYEKCPAEAKCLEIIEGVDHNAFHALDHIIRPVSTFLQKIGADRLPPLPITSHSVMKVLDEGQLLVPPDIPEPRGEGAAQPGFVVRAIGSLLGKTSEWGLDNVGSERLQGHPNIGTNNRPGSGGAGEKRLPNPKTAQEAKERGNVALASGSYDEAVAMYSIGVALDLRNHVLYSNRSAAHAHMRRFGKAKDNAAECVEISPDWWKGYVRLGQAVEMVDGAAAAFDVYMRGLRVSPGNPKLEGKLADVYRKSLGGKAELEASPLTSAACKVVLEHVHSMLQLLRCVVQRDWNMIDQNNRALNVLFPITAAAAAALPGEGSAAMLVLERTDFELLQPRTLFLRSVDAALECMLIYFGMESTYLYDSEIAGKRLLYRFATPAEARERAGATLLNANGAKEHVRLTYIMECVGVLKMCRQAHALSELVKAELSHKVGSVEQWQAWDATCARLDELPL